MPSGDLRADTIKAPMSSRSSYVDWNACWKRSSNVHPMRAQHIRPARSQRLVLGMRHVGYA